MTIEIIAKLIKLFNTNPSMDIKAKKQIITMIEEIRSSMIRRDELYQDQFPTEMDMIDLRVDHLMDYGYDPITNKEFEQLKYNASMKKRYKRRKPRKTRLTR